MGCLKIRHVGEGSYYSGICKVEAKRPNVMLHKIMAYYIS